MTPLKGGYFPIDMLRYEAAFPASETDSGRIERSMHGSGKADELVIRLEKFHPEKTPRLNDDRWRSFGWTIAIGSARTEKQ